MARVTEEDLRRIGSDAAAAYVVDAAEVSELPSPPPSPARTTTGGDAAAELLGSLALDDEWDETDDDDDDTEDGDKDGVSLGDGAMTRSRVGRDGDLYLENARLRADLAANVALLATIDSDRVRASKSAQTSQVLSENDVGPVVGVQTSRGSLGPMGASMRTSVVAMGRSMQTAQASTEGVGVQTSRTLCAPAESEGASTQTSQVLESEEGRHEHARLLAALRAREEEAGALRFELGRVTRALRQRRRASHRWRAGRRCRRLRVASPTRPGRRRLIPSRRSCERTTRLIHLMSVSVS